MRIIEVEKLIRKMVIHQGAGFELIDGKLRSKSKKSRVKSRS